MTPNNSRYVRTGGKDSSRRDVLISWALATAVMPVTAGTSEHRLLMD